MKKTLLAIVSLVLLLGAAVLVVPGMIDWNRYKGEIAGYAEAWTGRRITIAGDIDIAVLPRPAIVAEDVRMANVEDASAPDMLRLESLYIQISPIPLLAGTVRVDSVRLVKPVLELERLSEERVNWHFAPGAMGGKGGDAAPLPGYEDATDARNAGPAVRLDNFLVEDGSLVYRDRIRGTEESFSGIHGRFAAVSLEGPFESQGELRWRDTPLTFDAQLGHLIHDRTMPVSISLGLPAADATMEIVGTVLGLDETPRFKGKLTAGGRNLAGLLEETADARSLPELLARPFGLEGEVVADTRHAEMAELVLSFGNTSGGGAATLSWDEGARLAARINVQRLDLDDWLARAADIPATAKGAEEADRVPENGGFALPEGVSAALELTVGALTYREGLVSDARLNAELSGSEITVSQFSALMPGGSDGFASGFVSWPEGRPRFEGTLDLSVSDLRRITDWLGVEVADVPPERLRRATLSSRLVVTPESVQAREMDLSLDGMRVTGGVTIALRRRLAFGADFTIDQVTVDPYAEGAGNLWDDLGAFDANLRLRVEKLVVHGQPLGQLDFDGTLFAGDLEMRDVAVSDLAGGRLSASGKVSSLDGIPGFDALSLKLSDADARRLARLIGEDAPPWLRKLETVSFTGRLDGGLLRPQIELGLVAGELNFDAAGRIGVLPVGPGFDLKLRARHKDGARLLRLLDIGWEPRGPLGEVDLAAGVKGDAEAFDISTLSGTIGEMPVAGSARVSLAGPRPRVDARIKTGNLLIGPYLPAERSARLERSLPEARIVPAAWRPDEAGGPVLLAQADRGISPRWSRKPLTLDWLTAFDGSLELDSSAIVHDDWRIDEAHATARLAEGVLSVDSLAGRMYGGAFAAEGTYSLPAHRLEGRLGVEDLDLATYARAVRSETKAEGHVDGRLSFAATGTSPADLIVSLDGEGALSARRATVESPDSGSLLGTVFGMPLAAVRGLIGLFTDFLGLGGEEKEVSALADLDGRFTIEDGVARVSRLNLVSERLDATGKGQVDLAAWTLDLDWNVLGKQGLNVEIPVRIAGPLDKPNVKVDPSRLPGKAIQIPGALIDKSGDLLKKLIPGG